jgi:thiamine biosynthesis lipoprotein
MKRREAVMGMPIEIEIVGIDPEAIIEAAYHYLREVDEQFSTYKETSEISEINRGERELALVSPRMREVFDLAEKTKNETHGYFDMRRPDGTLDPSGIVKGWAIKNTALLIEEAGYDRYVVNAGGDIASHGRDEAGREWRFGIRNPFQSDGIVKVIIPRGKGIATSGSYVRGDHIYNPHAPTNPIRDVVSITVVGPDVLEADRFATAAFAMGKEGVTFIESLMGFEAYQISRDGVATFTSRFEEYTII